MNFFRLSFILGFELIRYANLLIDDLASAKLTGLHIKTLGKKLKIESQINLIENLEQYSDNPIVYDKARELSVYFARELRAEHSDEVGNLCIFSTQLIMYKLVLESGGNKSSLDFLSDNFWADTIPVENVIPINFFNTIKEYCKKSIDPEFMPKTEEAKQMANVIQGMHNTLKNQFEFKTSIPKKFDTNKVFIVHGHNDFVKEKVARVIDKIDLEAIILHEQPNAGKTIIEKFESVASNTGFAIILITGDDTGGTYGSQVNQLKPRARQNVILELGFFIGKLGRSRTCVLYEKGVEIPSDYLGVIYIPFDKSGKWKFDLIKELKEAGMGFNKEKLLNL